tara:strand:+ start:576 stop:1304 length:729 start_codon:yes stop_codon:yes gene_type:complete
MQKRKQILAMSNSSAFFVEPPDTPCLARYLVGLTGKERPVIVHVGAANGDSSEKVSKFCDLGRRAGFCPRHFNLFALENDDPDTFFAGADAVYVDGGSTRNLRALLREWSADDALRRAYEKGVVLSGASAGANIMFDWGMTDSVKTRIEAIRGMGMLKGTISVHSDARSDRVEALERHLRGADATYPAYALDDGTALHFEDGAFTRAIAVKTGACVAVNERGDGATRARVEDLSPTRVADTL